MMRTSRLEFGISKIKCDGVVFNFPQLEMRSNLKLLSALFFLRFKNSKHTGLGVSSVSLLFVVVFLWYLNFVEVAKWRCGPGIRVDLLTLCFDFQSTYQFSNEKELSRQGLGRAQI